MNFFERQAAARRTSSRLLLLFALAVAGIVIAVDLGVYVVAVADPSRAPGEVLGMVIAATVVTLAIIGFGSLYRIASLRGGGDVVARQLGGTPVPEQTSDPQLRRLRNVVEEIAIASGVPMPRLFVMEQEHAINAFAAGYAPTDAVVAVTRGALEKLNRDELQGVVAHEFSHILNGDMRLNIRLMGVLFGILVIALVGRKILEHGRFGRSKDAMPLLLAALAAMAIGYLGLFFGRMIKAGVSRTREVLADASAVQFTRQTVGLAGALKKIAGVGDGAKLTHRTDAEEVSHMLFGDGVGLHGLFATHPPLVERIRALEPTFDARQLSALKAQWMATPPNGMEEDLQLGLVEGRAPPLPAADTRIEVSPATVAAQVAQPTPGDYRRADGIVAAIPAQLRTHAARRDDVVPLVLALLFDDDPALRARQHEEVAMRLGREVAVFALALRTEHLGALHPMARLPLASLAFPALRLRPRPELAHVLDAVQAMTHADGHVSVFEYCLGTLLQRQIRESLDPGAYRAFGRTALPQARDAVATLLATVARSARADGDDARRAFVAGINVVFPGEHVDMPADVGVQALDAAWPQLDALDPLAKQAVVEGVTAAISHDGRVDVTEAELLRTVCGVLHCPLPPMLERG